MKQQLTWPENNQTKTRAWVSESDFSPPKKILLASDDLKANDFYQKASQGAAYIWRGDFQNAKQLLQAVQRRITKSMTKNKSITKNLTKKNDPGDNDTGTSADLFHKHRQSQAHRAQLLSRLLICVESDLTIKLPRAPDVRQAISEALPDLSNEFVISLRELLGIIGAHEWRKNGVYISALDSKIHPHYGIFSPIRGEYLDLIAKAPLAPIINCAFDIGTGTGVIAAILAKRGVKKIIATDLDARALACAVENISRFGFNQNVAVVEANLFPAGKADLIVCNPPWVPARPTSRLERAIYDENSQMLKGFLMGVNNHLTPQGEAWLILSNLAELLGLRAQNEIISLIEQAQLEVIKVLQTKPQHAKTYDTGDLLYEARSHEITNLWRLKKKA